MKVQKVYLLQSLGESHPVPAHTLPAYKACKKAEPPRCLALIIRDGRLCMYNLGINHWLCRVHMYVYFVNIYVQGQANVLLARCVYIITYSAVTQEILPTALTCHMQFAQNTTVNFVVKKLIRHRTLSMVI